MDAGTKTCFKCEKQKPLPEFYKHGQMKDGRLNKCKDCTRADVKQHRRSDEYREKVLEYDRLRGSRQTPEYIAEHRRRNPESYVARNAVNNALRDGRLEKPSKCQNCGSESSLHGHHYDYSKLLSVVWLCVACHRQHHAMLDLIAKVDAEHDKLVAGKQPKGV